MGNLYILLVICCAFTSCTPTIISHGYNFEQVDISKIKIGIDNQEQVRSLLGSPSVISNFPNEKCGGSTWYYVAKKASYVSVCEPDILDQRTVAIDFDNRGIVRDIRTHKGENNQNIEFSKDKTDTTGYESGALKDVFGNFGRRYSKK